jgi:glycosyltransferase involved in cell wall biosynthesis
MKVLHVGTHFNPNRGGGNLRNSQLVNAFLAVDPANSVVLLSYRKDGIIYENRDPRVRLIYSNSSLLQLIHYVRELLVNRYDVVHFHNPRMFFLSRFVPFRPKSVLEFHGLDMLSGVKAFLLRTCVGSAGRLIVLGAYGREHLCANFPNMNGKVDILQNGNLVDKPILEYLEKRDSKKQKVVAYIGTFHRWQGVYNFVDGVKGYLDKNGSDGVRFIMVGGGPEFEGVKAHIEDIGLNGSIEMVGHIPPSEIASYWQLTDVLVIPRPSTQATETTVPLKLIEALAYGVLVIGSSVKGLTEHIHHLETGLVYQHDKLDTLIDALSVAVQNESLHSALRENAKAYAERLPTWRDVALQLSDIYSKAVAQ